MIQYIHEPTELQCGQAVLAMVTGLTVEQVCSELGNDRETNLRDMKSFLRSHGVWVAEEFYDPEHGVMEDFPESARKYYWEIRKKNAAEKSITGKDPE